MPILKIRQTEATIMNDFKDKNLASFSPLAVGISLIILGILFCALRAGFVSILLTIVGVVLIVLGALSLVGKNWTLGIIEVAVGIVIIACGWTIVDITLLILGIAFIAYAAYQMIVTIPLVKNKGAKAIVTALLNPIFMLILGIILVVAKWQMIDAIFITVGVVAIVAGILMIIKSLTVNNAMPKENDKTPKENN